MEQMDCIDSICAEGTDTEKPSPLVRLFDGLLTWLERSRERASLGRLDDRALSDFGQNRSAAAAESRKPFWRE
ncbi:MAG TPA: hypothetical protein VK196_07610 [Magnetospirillum sp.]|nr:hypothetical protein [Magnetospirillum sp.]